MIIAQISDTHIKRKGRLLHHMIDTARYLKRAVKRLNHLDPPPDAVLATGDLTESGKPKEYRRLRNILADLEIPLFVIPGNHDNRANFRDAFYDHAYLPKNGPYVQYVIEQFPVRLIGLDSLAVGESGGELDEVRLRWLETRLVEQPLRPTLLFLHHPPFKTGIRAVDALGFRGVEEFAALVQRHPQVIRVVAGHIHRPIQIPWAGTYASTAPSTAHQVVLDLRERRPLGFVLEPPGFALHVWQPQGGLISYACVTDALGAVVDYPGFGDLRDRQRNGHLRALPTFVADDRPAS
jgi:3',5'-cyclic AMP phosphodiesterase CpdA